MATIKSYGAYSPFPHYSDPNARLRDQNAPGIPLPHCFPLRSASAAAPDAVGVALLSQSQENAPRSRAVSVLAVHLPPPSFMGHYDAYEAVLFDPGVISFVVPMTLIPDDSQDGAWAGSFDQISQRFSPSMRVIVRLVNTVTGAKGSTLLSGDVESE